MFKKFLIILVLVVVLVLILGTPAAQARQGCCSGHGGVCECECCDGKPLSAVCRPYYPECKGVSFRDDRYEMKQDEVKRNGWWLAALYVVGVSLLVFFAKIGYKRKKSKN